MTFILGTEIYRRNFLLNLRPFIIISFTAKIDIFPYGFVTIAKRMKFSNGIDLFCASHMKHLYTYLDAYNLLCWLHRNYMLLIWQYLEIGPEVFH